MAASIVDITTFSDADFAEAFRWKVGDDYFDLTDHNLAMMVRKTVDDEEVFISLTSDPYDGIDIGPPEPGEGGELTLFTIFMSRSELAKMEPGVYVHSLILIRPDGLRDDIWRGTLTHAIGPTR